MQNRNQIPRWERLTIAAVVLWGGLFRLGWVGTNSFSFDEARVSAIALRMARAGDFAELGMQSSTGVPNFPAAAWIFAIPYFFSSDPLIATLFAGLICTAGVLGIWWLCRQVWDPWVAIGIAILFATAPFIVFYSRSIWAQNLLPPLAILWAVTAVHGISLGDWRTLTLHAFLSGFIGQVHLAGIALAMGSLWLGLVFRLWRHWKPVSAGIALGVAAAMPTLMTIWRFGDGARADLAAIGERSAQNYPGNFKQLLDLASGTGWEGFWLNQSWVWEPGIGLGLTTIRFGMIALIGFGALVTLIKGAQLIPALRESLHDRRPTASDVLIALLPVWAVVAPLFFFRSRTPSLIQYQLASVPALFMFVGAAIGWFPRKLPRSVSIGFAALCLAAGLVTSGAMAHTLNTIRDVQVEGGMGTPLSYPRAAALRLSEQTESPIIHSIGNNPAFDGDAAVFDVLLWESEPRIVDARSGLLIPPVGGVAFGTFDSIPAWQQLQALRSVGPIQSLPRRENEPPYQTLVVTTPPRFDETEAGWRVTETELENGATLIRWRYIVREDGTTRLETVWSIDRPIAAGEFQQFNHLYSTANLDGPTEVRDASTSSAAWRVGDTLVTWAEFPPVPEGAELTRFDVGMYTWPDLQRSPVLGREGDPLAPIQLLPYPLLP